MAGRLATLVPHPASRADGARAVSATAAFDAQGGLALRYRVDGTMSRLRWPVRGSGERADGLWQHGCFEAFLRADERTDYLEFNFAPGGDWAAYRFAGRRRGRESPAMTAPRIEFDLTPGGADLSVQVAAESLASLAGAAVIRAGLAAIVEDADGRLAYWALAHGAAEPDFHDPATFTLALPAP